MQNFVEHLYILPILLFSVVVHEVSHGYMALRLGDPTAKLMGRLTFNPIPHIDPVGSVLVPLFSLFIAGQIFIAWAKPVPINPLNFSNFKRDDILVSVIGPLSNIFMTFVCTVSYIVLVLFFPHISKLNFELLTDLWIFVMKMFMGGIYLNIILAVFNMIPIPPLDGSHVVASLLPDNLSIPYRQIGFLGIFVIILLMRVDEFRTIFFTIVKLISYPFISLIQIFV